MSAVSVDSVSRTIAVLFAEDGRSIVYWDGATGHDFVVSPASAASPSGLLPAFIVAGEAVWREVTGNGFSLDIVREPQAPASGDRRGSFGNGDARHDGGDGTGRRPVGDRRQ